VCALDRAVGEGRADADPLERVGDLDRDLCDRGSIGDAYIPGDTHEGAVVVECGDGFIVTVIDFVKKVSSRADSSCLGGRSGCGAIPGRGWRTGRPERCGPQLRSAAA
jgi:hypothetical protein